MPMRISLALGERRTLSRQTAWGCLTTNLALPGFGSLVAGRGVGYAQAALGLVGLAVTLVFGTRFIVWYVTNWSRINDPLGDPLETLSQLWQMVRWPLVGIGLFAVGWIWGLVTGLAIVREAREATPDNAPPRLS
jgi:hypothetical protein